LRINEVQDYCLGNNPNKFGNPQLVEVFVIEGEPSFRWARSPTELNPPAAVRDLAERRVFVLEDKRGSRLLLRE